MVLETFLNKPQGAEITGDVNTRSSGAAVGVPEVERGLGVAPTVTLLALS